MQMGPRALRGRSLTRSHVRSPRCEEVASEQSDEPPSGHGVPLSGSCETALSPVLPSTDFFLDRRLPRMGPLTRTFRREHFPLATDRQWHDWRWQLSRRIRRLDQLERMCLLSQAERSALVRSDCRLPFAVTPYYMSLIDPFDPQQPLRRCVIPVLSEFERTRGEADDPLSETGHGPVEGIVHRYPDRVLLMVHDSCSTYCRYCTRSRVVGHDEMCFAPNRLQAALQYLREHTEVRDVLLSGGDPLTLADDSLDWLLGQLRGIRHLQILRIGTKAPAVLPQRITPQLVRVLKKHHPLLMSLHFTHPDECTPESALACRRLADAGIPLGSQTVLLKGINDQIPVMLGLMHRLLMMRVKPYYLYQCDPITGSAHFRTSVARGLEIIRGLRGHTSGYAVPTYVIDAPGGGGKIPLLPDYLAGREGEDLLLRSYTGEIHRYPDPRPTMEAAR